MGLRGAISIVDLDYVFETGPNREDQMKAIVFHQHGGPEVLKYEDAPEPVVRANDVLVRVKACALNHLDLWGAGRPAERPDSAAAHSR